MKALVLAILSLALTAPVKAQWMNYPTPGIPRTADGKPNINAPDAAHSRWQTRPHGSLEPSFSEIWRQHRGGPEARRRPAVGANFGRPAQGKFGHAIT